MYSIKTIDPKGQHTHSPISATTDEQAIEAMRKHLKESAIEPGSLLFLISEGPRPGQLSHINEDGTISRIGRPWTQEEKS